MVMVSCSLWSADLGCLSDEIEKVNDLADAFHFDVMDGHFVQNFLFGEDTRVHLSFVRLILRIDH